jgi:hypothetical protein
MFAVTLRFVAGLAIGGAAALWLARQRRVGSRRPQADETPENARIDDAVEDTFPASDPPAFMQSLIAGRPQEQPSEEETAEAHPS